MIRVDESGDMADGSFCLPFLKAQFMPNPTSRLMKNFFSFPQ
jgi:hypothetical protein